MEPIGWPRVNKLAGIVSSRPMAALISARFHVFTTAPVRIHFHVHRFVVVLGISIQYQSHLAGIDIVVKITNSDAAVITHLSESAVEPDPENRGPLPRI